MREMNMTDPISVMGMINGSVYFGGASPGFGIQMDVITALVSYYDRYLTWFVTEKVNVGKGRNENLTLRN